MNLTKEDWKGQQGLKSLDATGRAPYCDYPKTMQVSGRGRSTTGAWVTFYDKLQHLNLESLVILGKYNRRPHGQNNEINPKDLRIWDSANKAMMMYGKAETAMQELENQLTFIQTFPIYQNSSAQVADLYATIEELRLRSEELTRYRGNGDVTPSCIDGMVGKLCAGYDFLKSAANWQNALNIENERGNDESEESRN